MFYSIIFSLLQAIVAVAIISALVYLFIKRPMVLICTLAVAIVLGGLIIVPSIAEEAIVEVNGYIIHVAPEFFNGYPVLVVTVETFEGEVYTYFSEEEIDTTGIVTLLLFGEEVIDVY